MPDKAPPSQKAHSLAGLTLAGIVSISWSAAGTPWRCWDRSVALHSQLLPSTKPIMPVTNLDAFKQPAPHIILLNHLSTRGVTWRGSLQAHRKRQRLTEVHD